MLLVDLSMVEQRYDAVREVLDGATVKDTAMPYSLIRNHPFIDGNKSTAVLSMIVFL